MDQLIPGLAALVEAFRDCFHPQVFQTFQTLLAGWIVCLGPHTISEVWQATGLAAKRHHDTAYAVFHSAAWEWDDLGIVLATLILTHLIPGGVVWVVVDDTLCHKRGAKVAFGGIFLDAVLSSKRKRTVNPVLPRRLFCWVGPLSLTQEPVHGTTQRPESRTRLAANTFTDSSPAVGRSPSFVPVRESLSSRSVSGTTAHGSYHFPDGPSRPCWFPSSSTPQPASDHPAVSRGVEIELPHQVRLRFEAPPEPEWLGRLVAALGGLPSQEATSSACSARPSEFSSVHDRSTSARASMVLHDDLRCRVSERRWPRNNALKLLEDLLVVPDQVQPDLWIAIDE